MRKGSIYNVEDTAVKPTYTHHLPKKKLVPERKKIRQLLRSMLPMEDDERQYQEEQNLHHKRSRAQ